MKHYVFSGVKVPNGSASFGLTVVDPETGNNTDFEYRVENEHFWARPVEIRYSRCDDEYNVSYGAGGSNSEVNSVEGARIKAEALLLAAGIVENLNNNEPYFNSFEYDNADIISEKA